MALITLPARCCPHGRWPRMTEVPSYRLSMTGNGTSIAITHSRAAGFRRAGRAGRRRSHAAVRVACYRVRLPDTY